MFYTRKCGEIEPSDFESEQTLCGWLQDTRNLGGIAFIQLRDITGVIQLTLLKKKLDEKKFKNWTNINRESVVLVRGTQSPSLREIIVILGDSSLACRPLVAIMTKSKVANVYARARINLKSWLS